MGQPFFVAYPLFVPALAVLAALAVSHAVSGPAAAMDGYKWSKRPLVVFAPTSAHPALAHQRREVAARRPAMMDRQMVVVWVVGDAVSAELGVGPKQPAAALRARYGVGGGEFRAVLVGKDGGVKLSSGDALSAAKLFATIDAMPMRRDEMRR